MSLEQARSAASFPVVVPADLGDPDRVTVTPDGRLVTMEWSSETGRLIRLDQIGGSLLNLL